jgi:hypothetical protein
MSAVSVHGPVAVAKRAVCWLDVFVFAIFVTVSLWSLSAADLFVNEQRRELTPVKETFEHEKKVPLLQAGSTMAQDELKMLQNKLFDLRMEAMRLAADLKLRARNPRVRLLSPQREQRIKLETTQTMVRAYETQVPEKMQQVATTAAATFAAKHSAELAYDKQISAFKFANKMRVLALVASCWAILSIITGLVCSALRDRFGHGSALHVWLPGSLLMALACIYYVVK